MRLPNYWPERGSARTPEGVVLAPAPRRKTLAQATTPQGAIGWLACWLICWVACWTLYLLVDSLVYH